MYDNADPPRQLPVIDGGFHCGFLDSNSIFCDSGSIPRSEQLAITRRLLTAWFNLYLKQDQSVWPVVWGEAMVDDPDVDTLFDPGVVVQPAAAWGAGHAGSTVSLNVLVRNTGAFSTSYSLFVSDSLWPALLNPSSTPGLAPDEQTAAVLIVTLPSGTDPFVNRVVISARSDADGATRGWSAAEIHITPRPDFDLDRDVDADDLAHFEYCLSGPAVPQNDPGCDDALLDGDSDVDQQDFAIFQRCYSGEMNPADPGC
jgi:hypothetical protein